MRTVIALAAVAGLVTACGYKGPLYLPKPNAKQHAPAQTARPAVAAPLAASAPVAASAPAAELPKNTNQDKTSP